MAGWAPKQYRQPEELDLRGLHTVGGGADRPKGLRAATRAREAGRLEGEAADAEARFDREAEGVVSAQPGRPAARPTARPPDRAHHPPPRPPSRPPRRM